MKLKFPLQSFDVAPLAPRYTTRSWAVLWGGVVFLLACAWPFVVSIQSLHRAVEVRDRAQATKVAVAQSRKKEEQRLSDPAAIRRTKAQQQLDDSMRLSWSGILEALEIAATEVRGGVSLLSLAPSKIQPDLAEVSVTALASSPNVMIAYVNALRTVHPVRHVEMVTQQTDERIGPGAIRFQLAVSWQPSAKPDSGSGSSSSGIVK